MARDRAKAEAQGRLAETAALTLLRLKGYRLLARRFKCAAGEVDLIMRKRDVTVFIEVKSRETHDAAVQSLTNYQSRRIAAAATYWMANDVDSNKGPCRFDIVAVNSHLIPKHVENAFEGAW